MCSKRDKQYSMDKKREEGGGDKWGGKGGDKWGGEGGKEMVFKGG